MATTTRTRSKKRGTGKGKKVDSYQVVTDVIIEALEAGVVPWHKPWRNVAGEGAPMSLSSRKPYRGVNVWTLWATAAMRGYSSSWWGTYNQLVERGGQVRAGEKGTPVVFWRKIEVEDPDDSTKKKAILLLKHFVVFNVDQCDGEIKLPGADEPVPEVELDGRCQDIVADYQARGGPRVEHGGNQAFWNPVLDFVRLPKPGQFESIDHYYGAAFHELGHSTGHPSRLNRPDAAANIGFGEEAYSREELVAEMTAAFCCGEAGIEVLAPFRASYIKGWLSALRGDVKLVVSAGGQAQKAADLILGCEPESNPTNEEGATA